MQYRHSLEPSKEETLTPAIAWMNLHYATGEVSPSQKDKPDTVSPHADSREAVKPRKHKRVVTVRGQREGK